jgi:hypothetical protein
MPRRKNTEALPKYSFVAVESNGNDVSWIKLHSGSARRHAAYWGGPSKFQGEDEKNRIKQHEDTIAIVSDADEIESAAVCHPLNKKYVIRI